MGRPDKRFTLASAILALSLGIPALALAQEPSAADRETARALLIEGRAKMEAKDYQGALRSLKAAHAIMHVPTTGLDYARALEATGQLVEARTLALDVTRLPEKQGEPEAFRNARVAAQELATKLEARIPSVVVNVKGLARGVEPTVMIDADALPAAALGLPRKVDPGAHVVKVTAPGYLPAQKKVELAEGATSLAVDLAMVVDKSAPPAPPPEVHGPRPVPAWAWAMGGVGVVGLAVGIGFAADYASVKGTVAKDCPNDACTPSNYTAATALKSQWNRDLGVMSAGLAIGVVGVATAVVGIARSRSGDAPKTALAPWFAPGAGGLAASGAF